jgi:hypothetical protein
MGQLVEYVHRLRRQDGLEAGNSVVRAFNVHSAQYFSIEQDITVTVQNYKSEGGLFWYGQTLAMAWPAGQEVHGILRHLGVDPRRCFSHTSATSPAM